MEDKVLAMIERLIKLALWLSAAVAAFWKVVNNKILRERLKIIKEELSEAKLEIERLKSVISGMDRR